MTKHILLAVIFSLLTGLTVKAQVSHAQWKLSAKKISDCEYDLIFSVTLDQGWHTFSAAKIKDNNGEVMPTEIIFIPNKDYILVGSLIETKPTAEYDKTINKTVLLHYNHAVFTQRIKLNSGGKVKVSGRYEYQVCKEVCEKPPYEPFDFDLQGTRACPK